MPIHFYCYPVGIDRNQIRDVRMCPALNHVGRNQSIIRFLFTVVSWHPVPLV